MSDLHLWKQAWSDQGYNGMAWHAWHAIEKRYDQRNMSDQNLACAALISNISESDRAAAEVTETESSAPAASEPRENPIEPDPNPKRRLIMKSASTTAGGSGQEREMRAIPDDDSRMQIEDKPEVDNEERAEPPGAPSTSIRRRIAVKSEP